MTQKLIWLRKKDVKEELKKIVEEHWRSRSPLSGRHVNLDKETDGQRKKRQILSSAKRETSLTRNTKMLSLLGLKT